MGEFTNIGKRLFYSIRREFLDYYREVEEEFD